MPTYLRFQLQSWATHHVVSRCIQSYAFLKIMRKLRAITKGVLVYSLEQFKESIDLHHYVVLSNHFHIHLSANSSPDLASFMCYFKGNLARELAIIHDWHGTLWQKRYFNEEIQDETALTEGFKYITQNSVKESLVDHPKDWTGLHCYHPLLMGKKVGGSWIDRTAYYHLRQRRESRIIDEFTA